jgi:hypothetical protein
LPGRLLLALPGVVVMVPPLSRLVRSPVGRLSTGTTLGTETHRSECEPPPATPDAHAWSLLVDTTPRGS